MPYLERNHMGQNQSKPEGSERIIFDDTISIVAQRLCENAIENGHGRPIPPPQNRGTVLAELRRLASPKTEHSATDPQSVNGLKRRSKQLEEEPRPDLAQDNDTAPTQHISKELVGAMTQPSNGRSTVHPEKKKRRLFVTNQAVEIAGRGLESTLTRGVRTIAFSNGRATATYIESMHADVKVEDDKIYVNGTAPNGEHVTRPARPRPFSHDLSDDEGYQTFSPPTSTDTNFSDDDGSLVKELARMHQCSVVASHTTSDIQAPTPPDSSTLRKIQEEDNSAEQSRLLREKKRLDQGRERTPGDKLSMSSSFLEDDDINSDDEVHWQYSTGNVGKGGRLQQLSPHLSQRPHEPRKFYSIDLGPGAFQKRSRSKSLIRKNVLGSSKDKSAQDTEAILSPRSTNPNASIQPQLVTSAQPLSMLEMMAKRAQVKELTAAASYQSALSPPIDLGTIRDITYEDREQVKAEHERLKEQQKDLEAIETTCLAIAKIRVLGPLTAPEAKEEHEVRKFISIVLDGKKSGKDRRSRMIAIRGNFGRRLEREEGIPTENGVRDEFINLLGTKRAQLLNDLRDPLDDVVTELRAKRFALRGKREFQKHTQKARRKKQVRFAAAVIDEANGQVRKDLPDGTVIDLDGPRQKPKPPSKTEKEITLLRERLRLFESQEGLPNDEYLSLKLSGQAQERVEDSDSEVSEEEQGAEYVFGAGRDLATNSSFTAPMSFPGQRDQQELDVEQDLDEINRLENARQQEEGARVAFQQPPGGSQRPDPELIERMREAYLSRSTAIASRSDDLPFDDLGDLSDASVASSSKFSSSSDHPVVREAFRYSVVGQFVGIDIYHPEDVYILKTFHDLDRANEFIQRVMLSLASDRRHVTTNKDWELQTRCRGGVLEQVLKLGGDEHVQGKAWIERDIIQVDTGKIIASKAKKAILGEQRGTWVVDWEKGVSTAVTVESAATPNGAATGTTQTLDAVNSLTNGDKEEDLFGDSPPPDPAFPAIPTQQTASTVTRPTPDEILSNIFTTPALANRAAKERYISWFAQFCPENERRPYSGNFLPARSESRYEGMLGQVDRALEEELERLGDWGLGVWEQEVKSDGGRTKERMKVWVRRVGVLGPQN